MIKIFTRRHARIHFDSSSTRDKLKLNSPWLTRKAAAVINSCIAKAINQDMKITDSRKDLTSQS